MASEPLTPDDLLQRAYALDNEADAQLLYEDWAQTYDQTMLEGLKYLTPQRTAALLAQSLEVRDEPVLDVGSGTGLAGQNLAEHGFTTIDALDFSPAMLEVAKRRTIERRAVYRKVIQADLNGPLDLADNTYTALICTGTFTHAHVGAGCLDELFRVLKPGGLFACTIHKDVWDEAGFAQKAAQLKAQDRLAIRHMQIDIYFDTDTEPQCWFIVWEKPNE